MSLNEINGLNLYQMVKAGAITLRTNMQRINDLNVFPIADGDTATNMLMTVSGGLNIFKENVTPNIGLFTDGLAKGMLMGARGNSGVILSQIFFGIAEGLKGKATANALELCNAFAIGTQKAYDAVMEPTEGTILTVMREATENAGKLLINENKNKQITVNEFISNICVFMQTSLENTPNQLAVLKEAGVVDSGGAGLLCIMQGMKFALSKENNEKNANANVETECENKKIGKGERKNNKDFNLRLKSQIINGFENESENQLSDLHSGQKEQSTNDFGQPNQIVLIDLNKFTENSVMKFGYCTEFLLRLQNGKIDVNQFNLQNFKANLEMLGDSIVTFQNGTIVKVHIHTFKPENVLSFCHGFGEFLTIKIENMTLQHNETHNVVVENWDGGRAGSEKQSKITAKNAEKADKMKKYATVTVASGQGICETFRQLGADYVIEGGQSSNPSTQDFINAFNAVNATNIFVLPNNSNIILTAKQAGELYEGANIVVIESKNIGEGYAVLQMLNYNFNTIDEIKQNMIDAMQGVKTALVSKAVRSADLNGVAVAKDCYVGLENKKVITSADTKEQTALQLMQGLNAQNYEFAIIIYGESFSETEKTDFKMCASSLYSGLELYEINGGQNIYDMIIILQ